MASSWRRMANSEKRKAKGERRKAKSEERRAKSEERKAFSLRPKYLPVVHHELHSSQFRDVLQRIAWHRDHVSVGSGRDHANLSGHAKHLCRTDRCRADCLHWRHSELHHVRKFLRDRLSPREAAYIRAEDDLDPSLKRLLEGLFMFSGSGTVALPRGRVLR